jgi:hypothetical protein
LQLHIGTLPARAESAWELPKLANEFVLPKPANECLFLEKFCLWERFDLDVEIFMIDD